jgi:hypothetical protein
MARSVGNAYVTREACTGLLAAHHAGRAALVYAVGEHVTAPGSFLLTDPMSVLEDVEGPQANGLVLRLLAQPEPAVRDAAAWVAAAKVARGDFADDEMARLERVLVGLTRDRGLERTGTVSRVADLVAVLPSDVRERVLRALPAAPPESDPVAGDPPDRSVLGRVVGDLVADVGADDPMVERLVSSALAHEEVAQRFLSVFTLYASPHRRAFAAACAEGLSRLLDDARPDGELTHRLLVALSIVAGEAERPLLADLATGPRRDLHRMALTCLAHLPPAGHDVWPPLRAFVSSTDDGLARSALYCAGMTGDAVLHAVAADRALPAWRRDAAAWWRERGPAIHEPPSGFPASDVGTGSS